MTKIPFVNKTRSAPDSLLKSCILMSTILLASCAQLEQSSTDSGKGNAVSVISKNLENHLEVVEKRLETEKLEVIKPELSVVDVLESISIEEGADFKSNEALGLTQAVKKITEAPISISQIGHQNFSFFIYDFELSDTTIKATLTGNTKTISSAIKAFLASHEMEADRLVELDVEGESSWHAIQEADFQANPGYSADLCVSGVAKPVDQIGFLVLSSDCES